jgi:hypothetical protein
MILGKTTTICVQIVQFFQKEIVCPEKGKTNREEETVVSIV